MYCSKESEKDRSSFFSAVSSHWTTVSFPEEISLDKIVSSGQCFRPKEIAPSCFRFITRDSVLYLKQVSARKLAFYINESPSSSEKERIDSYYLM